MFKKILLVLLLCLLASLFNFSNASALVVRVSLEELVNQSVYIVIGTVIRQYYLDVPPDPNQLTTTYNVLVVSIEKVIKGNPGTNEVEIRQLAYHINTSEITFLEDQPFIPTGHRRLFLITQAGGKNNPFWVITGVYQGAIVLPSSLAVSVDPTCSILEIMIKQRTPIALPLGEQLTYPCFLPFKAGAVLLITIIFAMGIALVTKNKLKRKSGMPKSGWNFIDWFWSVTWAASLIFAIYVGISFYYLWWVALLTIALCWGGTLYIALKRMPIIIQRR